MKNHTDKIEPKRRAPARPKPREDKEARAEFSSPPCYAHEFPGYFGEIETDLEPAPAAPEKPVAEA